MPSLSEVKPWGRSLTEYRAMFALTESDLNGRILDCGGGPAAALRELSRVASQARVFSLLNSDGESSPHLKPLLNMLMHEGYEIRQQPVAHEFQRGGNQMFVVSANT